MYLFLFEQKVVFKDYEKLNKFALANVARIDTRESLTKHFSALRFVFF